MDVIERSKGLTFKDTDDEIDRSVSKGIASAHEAYRRVQRGELFFAQSLLDSVRYYMILADDWINNRPPRAVTFSKLEQRGSELIIKAFENTYVGPDGLRIDGALMELLFAYRRQVIDLHEKFRLHRSPKSDLYAIDFILARGHGIA